MIDLTQISKGYPGMDAPVLNGIRVACRARRGVGRDRAIGLGKSTLLHLIGALDVADAGSVRVCGQALAELDENRLARFRNERVGFVFQLHYLLPHCTALENVLVPSLIHKDRASAKARAEALLGEVDLGNRLAHRPAQLSGGERQRVALVRAMINQPELLLADEPTGALNHESSLQMTNLLLRLNRDHGITLVIVTHSEEVSSRMDRTMELRDGRLSAAADPHT